ncbi:MAG: hypothetical protein EOM68_07225 [Spirochaetia bacterium]|nr:hypothetical protein [Spirochaetia bacterium]
MAISSQRSWNMEVAGSLSEAERTALTGLFDDVQSLSERFFAGDIGRALGDAMELPLDSYMQKGGIKPAGSIYEKMERTNYVVNSNILSATERYVSHLNTSYNMLPTMRAQLGAFTAWGNRFAKLAKQEGPDKAKYNTLRQVSDALAKDLKSRYERDVTFGGLFTGDRIGMRIGDQYVDFTTGLESVRKVARVVALVDVVRPILDLGPQEFRQFVEQGVAGFNLGRVQDLIPLYDYTPEGSFGKEFRTDLLNRYQSIGDRTGRMTKTEEWTQTYLALADRVSRQQAWATKFDEVYAQLSGERVDMERFKTDAKYKADVVGSESFERAVKLADQYQSRIHFADTAGAAGGEILGGVLKYGSKGYALFTPLSSYMLNQYYDAVAHGKMLLHGTGSDEWMSNRKATVKAAQGLGGAFANTMAYTYMSGLSRMGTMIAVYGLLGRPDLAEEEKEKLEDMFSWRGVGVNAISSAFSIIQSGGAQLGATLLTLTADVMEGAILSNVDTNIEKKEMKALIKAIRQSAGVIQYQQFDFEREQMGTRSMANLVFPVGGTFLYDTMKGIGQGALFATRERGERAEMIPLREDEQLLAFVRAATLLGVGMISGFPGSKDLDRLMKGLERSAKTDPYWPNIEDKRSFLSMKGAIESEVERISTNPHLLYKPNGQLRTVEDFRTLADDVAKEYLETKKRFDGLDGKKSYYDILHGMELNKDGIAWLDALYTDIKDSRKLEPKQKYEMFQLLDGVYEDMQKGVWNGEFVQVWSKTTKVFRDNFDREFLDDVVISVSKEMRKAETQVKGFKK